MLLLVAECNFTKEKLLLQTCPNKSSKIDYQWNSATTFERSHRLLPGKLYTNSLKLYLSCHLVPVHACNLALLPDNCNATQKIFPSNWEARRNDPIFTWAYFIWVICMLQFYALFCIILIEKFQNYSLCPYSLCTVYALISE